MSLSVGEWILTITLLTGALATPIMGRLADGPRPRDVIPFTPVCVVVGCMLVAVSENFTELLIGRGLQGIGFGILPAAMAIAPRHLSPEKARRAIATLSVTTAMGVGLGYPITGLIAQAWDLRAAYWFGAITVGCSLVFAVMVLAPRLAPRSASCLLVHLILTGFEDGVELRPGQVERYRLLGRVWTPGRD